MENNFKDNAGIRIPPPLYFLACLGFGLLLEYFFPSYLFSIPPMPRIFTGVILILLSALIAASALAMLVKNKTPFDPRKSTIKIVKDGPYRFSRNPMYLSMLLLLAGIAILRSSIWLFLAVPILYILILFKAILFEEKYLLKKFGKEYSDYQATVRRWI